MHDFHDLPKIRDSLSYLYVEHCKIDQEAMSIAIHDDKGKTPVPVSSLSLLMLGPGASITHAAIRALADNGCLAVWSGEEGVRFYAQGTGETRNATRIIQQARLCSDKVSRLEVVRRMYRMRFSEPIDPCLSIEQLRGKEGIRVRTAYSQASRQFGVEWTGRSYDRGQWGAADPVNRALSAANSCLYGLCHAAILSIGYSPALGFIHTGKQLSFVYDIADLYKAELTIPLAFSVAANSPLSIEREVRIRCRDIFRENNLLQRIVPDIDAALDILSNELPEIEKIDMNIDPAYPTALWNPKVDPTLQEEEKEWF